MKRLILLPLLLLLFACSKPDNERIIGRWHFSEIYEGGKLTASADVAQQEKLVDEQLKKQAALFQQLGMDTKTVKKEMLERMKTLSKSGFEFTAKDFFEFKDDKKDAKRKQQYKLDEKNHTITVMENGKPLTDDKVNYSFEDDKLVLKMKKVKVVLVQM